MNAADARAEARRRFGPSAVAIDHGPHGSPTLRYVVKARPDAVGIRDGATVGPSFDECFRRLDSAKRHDQGQQRDRDRAALRRLAVPGTW